MGHSHVKHLECGGIHIGIDDDDTLLRRFDNLLQQHPRLKELAVVEDLLHRRKRRTDKEIYLFFRLGDATFQILNSLIDSITAE